MRPRAEKLYQKVVNAIASAIEQGRYATGTRLPGERELAEDFAVSRPTIREAMIALEIRGLVEARHGSGLYVTEPPKQTAEPAELDIGAFELLEARILFEGETAALAATVIDDAMLVALDRVLTDMAGCDPGGGEAMAADRQFHLLIAEATGNTAITMIVETLWNLRDHSRLSAHMFAEARREGVNPRVEEHRLIVDALRNRDSAMARAAMRSHLKRVVDDLLEATEVEALRRTRFELEERRGELNRRLDA